MKISSEKCLKNFEIIIFFSKKIMWNENFVFIREIVYASYGKW